MSRRLRVWLWWHLWTPVPRALLRMWLASSRTPLAPFLAQTRFRVRRWLGIARADGRNYVGWTARITADMTHRKAPPVGTVGRVTHARCQVTTGELEHDIDFGDGQHACTWLPRPGIELIKPTAA